MKGWRLFKKFIIVYITLLLTFTLTLTIVCALPSKAITSNIKDSIPLLIEEGDYPRLGSKLKNYQLDNYTDSIMLNVNNNIDRSTPFLSAIKAVIYWDGNDSQVATLESQINNNKLATGQYARYWHGYLVFIRPLLLFSTYSDIRIIYGLVFSLLITIVIVLFSKKISLAVSIAFAASLASINFFIVQFSLQFSSVYFVAFITIIYILLMSNYDSEKMAIIFFVIGACTCFVDLLTAPLITFGLPAITLLICRKQVNQKSTFKNDLLFIIIIGLSWVAGYTLLWLSKWIIASIVLQKDVLAEGLFKIFERTGGVIPEKFDSGTPLVFISVYRNLLELFHYFNSVFWFLLFIIPGLFIVTFVFWHKNFLMLSMSLQLVLIATLPYIWFVVASNHSAIHDFFTYRIQAVTIMAILCAMYFAIDWQKLRLSSEETLKSINNIRINLVKRFNTKKKNTNNSE